MRLVSGLGDQLVVCVSYLSVLDVFNVWNSRVLEENYWENIKYFSSIHHKYINLVTGIIYPTCIGPI